MYNHDITSLFYPRSVAVIGATNKKARAGGIILELLQRSNIELYPVHPKEKEISGIRAYASAEDLPNGIDLAVIAVEAQKGLDAAVSCAKKGVAHLIVVAGGFSETGEQGSHLEQRLQEISKQYGTRILGPNTLGVFQPENKLDTIFVEHGDQALAGGGGVSFISQSGSVGVEALGLASNTGFGMRAFVGLGNKCDLNELDFLRYFERDSRTTCLAFYLESLDQGRNFLEEAERTARKKPVVILKAGSSETGASAVSSHTGRLGGSNRVISGAFRQYGIQMARDDEELCDAAKTLSELPPPSGNKVALLTPAGGYGVMGADYVESKKERIQLVMAELRESSKQRIQRASFPFAAVNNPVDLTASVTDNMMGEALQCLLEDPGVDIIICTAFFAPPGLSEDLVTIIGNLVAYSNKPIIVFTQYGPFTDRYLLKFHEAGIVGFPSMSRAIRAARLLVERAEILKSFPA